MALGRIWSSYFSLLYMYSPKPHWSGWPVQRSRHSGLGSLLSGSVAVT